MKPLNFTPDEINRALMMVSMQTKLELENVLLRNRLEAAEHRFNQPDTEPLPARYRIPEGVIE